MVELWTARGGCGLETFLKKMCKYRPVHVTFEIQSQITGHGSRTRQVPFASKARASSTMSAKRKWDQAAPEASDGDTPSKATKTEDGKSASEAAAAAAAIAAKIAAQFAGSGSSGGGTPLGQKDPHDGDFTHDIDINDVRNRYLLTKGSTQMQVRSEN